MKFVVGVYQTWHRQGSGGTGTPFRTFLQSNDRISLLSYAPHCSNN